MKPEDESVHEVKFYGGPLHGITRAVQEAAPASWVSTEDLPGEGTVTVEYQQASPWWVADEDSHFAAVYLCESWIRADGQMKSRHGYMY
ncbi:MAG TPA: hypothetical protein VNF47_17375 [Streptosporangiaceae bacterium]|nr:hypothetical protein [Streptosporangiaceae bacterium]